MAKQAGIKARGRRLMDAPEMPWEGQIVEATYEFGVLCARLRDTDPYTAHQPNEPVLNQLVISLATELWDQNFSQSEIAAAFAIALEKLPHYAAGVERRSDEAVRLRNSS